MPIDPTSNNNNVARINGARPAESSRSAQRPAAASSGKSSGESIATARLSNLNTQDATHDINAPRVAAIRQGIADGTLTFDSGRVADGIIASARELAGGD